jgi:hypothetical protein
MELNARRTATVRETAINPECSVVFARTPEIQLYLEASNLKIKSDQFYQTAKDKLGSVLTKAQNADEQYVAGLAKFLADNGLKLSPVVLMSVLSNRRHHFDGSERYIFNTPQRIAEAVSLENLDCVHLNNSFKKNVLRKALQSMSEFTLRKNRMDNRKVKLKDLIKLLRPRPADAKTAELYKAIIENSKLSKLKDKDSLVSVKSSKELSDEDKLDYFVKNIETIPINQLIRNLKTIEYLRFAESHDVQKKIIDRMKKVDEKSLRYLNIFDLIEVAMHVPSIEKAMFDVTLNFIERLKKEAGDTGAATVLFDVSGSMQGDGIENGFKYLVVMSLLYNTNVYLFSDSLRTLKEEALVKYIKSGQLKKAHDVLEERFKKFAGGTALLDSIEQASTNNLIAGTLIVVSDEVSWKEGGDLRGKVDEIDKMLKGKKIVLINPTVYEGTVFGKNLIGIASLTSSVLLTIFAFTKPEQFVKYLRTYKSVTEK